MIKQILFDFDGVIIDSMSVRDEGFEMIAKRVANDELVEEFLAYHRYNAGLSRYVKFRYLYEEMLGKTISEKEVNQLAYEFSQLMKSRLTNKSVLIKETIEFIKNIHKDITMHIVSGSDEQELNFLCEKLGLSEYFVTIEGSPTHKNDLVENIMSNYNYKTSETILIGDSITDYNAAQSNGLKFIGFNNDELKSVNDLYVDKIDMKLLEM